MMPIPPKTIQVALIDDHRLFRRGMCLLVNNFSGYHVLFEAGNGKELAERIGTKMMPNIALLDINMPEMDGIATAAWLKQHYPDVKIIILSMFADAENVIALVKMGISGYILKDAEPQDFKEALDTVSRNEVYYPPFVISHLLGNLQLSPVPRRYVLNDREQEFLKFAVSDLTYREIADKMCISSRTVDGYRDNLFEKLQVKSRVGMVVYAVKNKLIEI